MLASPPTCSSTSSTRTESTFGLREVVRDVFQSSCIVDVRRCGARGRDPDYGVTPCSGAPRTMPHIPRGPPQSVWSAGLARPEPGDDDLAGGAQRSALGGRTALQPVR